MTKDRGASRRKPSKAEQRGKLAERRRLLAERRRQWVDVIDAEDVEAGQKHLARLPVEQQMELLQFDRAYPRWLFADGAGVRR